MRQRRDWIGWVGIGVALAFGGSWASAQTRPNLVFMLTDDQGTDAIEGAYWPNEMNCHTPTLARWAEQGRVFVNARVNPYCSPTRSCLLTGRQALRTGVTHVLPADDSTGVANLLSMQTQERTIAEVLHDLGYYTVFVDKWHVGWSESMGQLPHQQGFDEVFDYRDYLHLDDPDVPGDEHTTRMVDLAIDAVTNRPDPNAPFALFYWSIDAHARTDDAGGLMWWQVDPRLAPLTLGHPAPTDNVLRYRAVVEALDTELGRLLRSLNVTDANDTYRPASNTVVFYTGDNGTDWRVSPFGPDKAKGSLYERGLRVPLFIFGTNVPGDGAADPRLVNHVDFFDTIADIAGASASQRGTAPRDSMSFADAIGWAVPESLPQRRYTLSSLGRQLPDRHDVALADDRFKLIAAAGGKGLAPFSGDQFFDLVADPEETVNLVLDGMTLEQASAYFTMRDAIVDYWNSSVSESWLAEDFTTPVVHEDDFYRLVVQLHADGSSDPAEDEFYDLTADPTASSNLIPLGLNSTQQAAYDLMRQAVTDDLAATFDAPPSTIDIMAIDTLVLTASGQKLNGPMTIGHLNPGAPGADEARAFIKFDVAAINQQLPPGKTIDDVVDAQVVIAFNADKTTTNETDTGVITAYPVTVSWSSAQSRNWRRLETAFQNVPLGSVDLPPHVIIDPPVQLIGVPLPPGTPVSFTHNASLLDKVKQWPANPSQNFGVTVMAAALPGLGGDQRVDFMRSCGLRLTISND